MKKIIAALLLIILVAFSIATASAAEQKKTPGGVTITPAFQNIEINSDQAEKKGTFSLKNNSKSTAEFQLSTIDMGALDDTGGLIFSGLQQDYIKKYGLAEWVHLPKSKVDIPANKTKNVEFIIRNDSDLSPGGHYGAILVKQVPKNNSTDKQVSISPQAASLIFLLKRGGEKYSLTLHKAVDNHSIWSLPSEVNLNFKNDGNVHVIPRGIVRLENTFGDELSKSIINTESAYILPEHSRIVTNNFKNLPKTVWPGRYKIVVEYRYDGSDKFERYEYTFFTANLRVLSLLILAIIIITFLVIRFRKHIKKFFKKSWNFFKKIVRKLRNLLRNKK